MYKFIIGIAVVIAIKFSLNAYKYFRIKRLSKLHTEWLAHKNEKFLFHVKEAADLIKQANVPGADGAVNVIEPIGFNQARSYNAPLIDNLNSFNRSIASGVVSLFNAAIGTYKKRALDAFNPFYWLELIVFLPKHMLQYLGFDVEKHAASRLTNVLLTFLWWLLGVAVVYFRPYINEFLSSLLR